MAGIKSRPNTPWPQQVTVDPDRVLLDKNPANNVWKPEPKIGIAPFYSMLNETDLTTDYDKWNFGGGPWIGGSLYPDPWFTRRCSACAPGVHRTQIFNGRAYAAYRTEYRDLVVGADGLWDHWPLSRRSDSMSSGASTGRTAAAAVAIRQSKPPRSPATSTSTVPAFTCRRGVHGSLQLLFG